jgi:hypothetical protein
MTPPTTHEQFSVGEIAVAQNAVRATELNGVEVEVVQALHSVFGIRIDTNELGAFEVYTIRLPNGEFASALPHQLRKRKPPPTREQVSTWNDVIVWRPRESAVEHGGNAT